MPIIKFQPRPKVPPIGFFQPISVDPKDMMTDVEFLLGILKKINEIIAQTNKNTEFIDKYSGKIEEIEAEIASLREEMTQFPGATGISGLHSRRTRGDRHSSRVEAKKPALLSSRDGYLLELTGWLRCCCLLRHLYPKIHSLFYQAVL